MDSVVRQGLEEGDAPIDVCVSNSPYVAVAVQHMCYTRSEVPHLPAGDALSYVWISTYSPSVGPASANTVPSGRGGALIKANPATANAIYTSYTTNDYSSPVIHTVSSRLRWLAPILRLVMRV